MASQVTFDEWFATECKGLSFEARRLMQISWNAALTNGDQHFFVAELAETINYTDCKNATWSKLLDEVRRKEKLRTVCPSCQATVTSWHEEDLIEQHGHCSNCEVQAVQGAAQATNTD